MLGILQKHFIHIRASVLEQFVSAVKHNKRYLTVAQNAQLVSLLHQPKFSLGESNLKIQQQQIQDLMP